MKFTAVLLLAVAAAKALESDDLMMEEWKAFKLEHNKNYDDDTEDTYRMKIFAENNYMIAQHNQRYELGLESYSLKQNEFGDLLHHEFLSHMTGFNITVDPSEELSEEASEEDGATFIASEHVSLPATKDWRQAGAVTGVKYQGSCGSCWAFSATGALEGQHFRKTGRLVSLSEQNLVDCSSRYGNKGCRGGLMNNAFRYIKDNGGIELESSYPYEAVQRRCRYDSRYSGAKDHGFVNVQRYSEKQLLQAVATVGPVSVAIDASRRSFQFYSQGVYYDRRCSSSKLNHAVLAVGYGNLRRRSDYWLVKNSWGTSWGERGYVKMARNKRNHCGIASTGSYPLV